MNIKSVQFLLFLVLASMSAAAAETNSIETFRYSGTVVDAQKRPVGGALIECYDYSGRYSPEALKLEKSFTTGTNGTFDLVLPKVTTAVLIRKTGLAPYWREWNPKEDEEQQVTLSAPSFLAGEVKDESGKPVSDAEIWVSAAYMEQLGDDGSRQYNYLTATFARRRFSTRSGADGRFRIEGFPTNSFADLAVSSPGKVLRELPRDYVSPQNMRCRAGEEHILLELEPGGTVEGLVRSLESGERLEGVQIQLQGRRYGWPGARSPETRTDADGKFRLTEISPGSYQAVPKFGTNKLAEWVAEMAPINVASGRTTRDIEISATRGGFLEVQVLGKEDHRPVKAASVTAYKGNYRASLGSDAHGVVLMRLPPGDYQVSASREFERPEGISASVEAGKTNRLEIELNPPPTVAGILRDESGAPVPGVTVKLFGGYSSPNAGEAKTDSGGRFEIKWNPRIGGADRGFCLVASDPAKNLAVSQDVDEQTPELDLRLGPGLAATGRVEDVNGKPLTNGTVQVHLWVGNSGMSYEPKPLKTDSEGRFRIAGLPADRRFTLWVTARGHGSVSMNLEGESGTNEVQLETIVLKTADRQLAGQVVDADDKPVVRASVRLYGDGQPSASTITDERGRFRFEQVCEGRAQVSAYVNRAYGSVVVEGGDTNVLLRLGATASFAAPIPRRRSLKRAPLPELAGLGLPDDCAPAGKPILLCVVDVEQRPCRRFLAQLAEQYEDLKKRHVTVLALQGTVIAADSFNQWKEDSAVPFAVGRIEKKAEENKWASEVESFPWLILTDAERKVVTEGFSLEDLKVELAKVRKP